MFNGGSSKEDGEAAEDKALAHLRRHGVSLVQRNYRIARGPHGRGGEIDLIVRDRDGTLVFVEVRRRRNARFGGAAGSIDQAKRRRIIFTARQYLLGFAAPPPCRFDVVAIDGDDVQWLKAAFDAE